MFGELRTAGERSQLCFVRVLSHPPEKVWRALTEPEHLAAWFPSTIEGERAPGAPLRFTFAERDWTLDGKMVTCDPPRTLEFVWAGDVLRFSLEAHGDGCRLTLTDTFDEHGKASRDAAGWHECLARLEVHLGADPSIMAGQAWSDLQPRYAERFGPDASSVGPPG